MKKTKSYVKVVLSFVLMVIASVLGASAGVVVAAASALPDAGKVAAGNPEDGNAGIATETVGRAIGDPDFYLNDVDKRIVHIRPMATPIDQISRYASNEEVNSFIVKFYSVGTREIKCVTTTAMTAMAAGAGSTVLQVADVNMFTVDDTIRVVGVKGSDGKDLVLCVCGKESSTSKPIVYAVNGNEDNGQTILAPAIPSGTTLVRMGKACGELDVQTGRFHSIPTPETQYCQNFMMQIEQSTFDKIASKEVNWNFSDIEEDAIFDMRLAMENTFLFGVKNVIKHTSKDGMATYFTGGIWWMAGKDIEVGTYDATQGCAVISDEDLVDISKDLFVGTGVGNKRKVLLAGSDLLAALSKIKSDKFRLKDTVEVWHLKFKSWETDFGEILVLHHELFDANGMSDCGFALDPEYLSKRTFLSWTRNVLDLKKAGVRNTDAAVLQEASCMYLRYAKAHARLRLAQAAG